MVAESPPVVDAFPETASDVAVVVASVDVPETARVPCEIKDVVAVIVPPVMVEMVEESAERTVVKKLVVVAEAKVGVSVSA